MIGWRTVNPQKDGYTWSTETLPPQGVEVEWLVPVKLVDQVPGGVFYTSLYETQLVVVCSDPLPIENMTWGDPESTKGLQGVEVMKPVSEARFILACDQFTRVFGRASKNEIENAITKFEEKL